MIRKEAYRRLVARFQQATELALTAGTVKLEALAEQLRTEPDNQELRNQSSRVVAWNRVMRATRVLFDQLVDMAAEGVELPGMSERLSGQLETLKNSLETLQEPDP